MHEYSIVSSLLDRVAREAAVHPGALVRRVHVRVGALAGVDAELLATAFDTCRARSACDAAELTITQVAALWQCPRCHAALAPGAILRCPTCDRPAVLAAGGDIILERIEMEVSDV